MTVVGEKRPSGEGRASGSSWPTAAVRNGPTRRRCVSTQNVTIQPPTIGFSAHMSPPSVLMAVPGLRVTLGRYAAGTRQAWHTDKRSRISFVLRGEFYEEGPTGGFL